MAMIAGSSFGKVIASPCRIQRRRLKDWRVPEGAVYVGRPTPWGNPFTIAQCIELGFAADDRTARVVVVDAFREWLTDRFQGWWMGPESDRRLAFFVEHVDELRGKTLACWCPLDEPCHADVLAEIANR